MRAFLVYVRPIVEYNSIIWSLFTARDTDAVESVGLQRRFTKRLPTLKNLSYRERLKPVPWTTPYRFVLIYKIVFGLVYINIDDLFVFSPCQYTRGHKFKLFKRRTTNCVRPNLFSERLINCWNSLPHTVDFSSISKFKRTVKHVDFTDFFQILMFIYISLSFM